MLWCGPADSPTRIVADPLGGTPAERLLVFHPKEGWEPLCDSLGAPVPDIAFPKVNSRDELGGASDE